MEPPRKINAGEREFQAYKTLRTARANARHEGARKVRAAKVNRILNVCVSMSNDLLPLVPRKRRKKLQKRSKFLFLLYIPSVAVMFIYACLPKKLHCCAICCMQFSM